VMQGDIVAAESYEPASMKEQWSKTASPTSAVPAAAAAPAPAKK
jgi:hypothetical protein